MPGRPRRRIELTDVKFQFHVSPAEYEDLRVASRLAGTSMSEFIRVAIVQRIARLAEEITVAN